ncbi:MFS transporter [Actinospica sp. MGRD01-02]|uniref:MFS transporter n=1 Tax=Actinospica acidithermotolerans TaxID=2828514 RepID=A0A941IFM1_9ACTN|nr:MFS transporter [Actinospica acidithermotolerans]MBR7826485.1 MFS transporter [Actinospica acidithermotolerans]
MSTTMDKEPHTGAAGDAGASAGGVDGVDGADGAAKAGKAAKNSRLQTAVLLTVLGADVMDLLDSTIVNVGSPSIARDLRATTTQLQWIIAGYTLAMAVALITGGRLGDLYGRRRMFLGGIGAFTLMSALASASVDPQMLVTTRFLQGLAAALMLPQGLAIIRSVFPSDRAGAAMSIFGPVMGVAATVGPILGGALVTANLFGSQWRSIFWVNIPVGVLAFVCAWRVVPRDEPHGPDAPTLDVTGMLLSGIGMLLLVYPLIQGREKGWPVYMFVLMAASVPVFALFGLQQRMRSRSGRTPLVTLSLFRKPAFVGGQIFGMFFFCALGGLFLVLVLHLQLSLGYTSLHAGLTSLPFSLAVAIGAGLGGGLLAPKFGRHVLHAGIVAMAIGLAGLAWSIEHWGMSLTSLDLAPAYTLCGLGFGLLVASYFGIMVSAIEDHETGSAGGLMNALQQLANTLGAALFGTLYFNGLTDGHTSVSSASSTLAWATVVVVLCIPLGFLMPKRIKPSALEAH